MTSEYLLFAGTSHPELAKQVGERLGISLGKVKIKAFPDKEIGVLIEENVRGRDVFVLQSIARRPNFYLMEMLILVDALKRASARSVAAVIPYFGYARQDRKDCGCEPITARLVANLLERAGVNRVMTLDLHAEQIEGFFDVPVDNLRCYPLLVKRAEEMGLQGAVVVAPDLGSVRCGRLFAGLLGAELAVVDKHRQSEDKVMSNGLIGSVQGRDVLLVDDICSTGETLQLATRVCQKGGAGRVFAFVTHGLFLERLGECGIEKVVTTDTIPQKEGNTFEVVSVAPVIVGAMAEIIEKN